jgi:hypothetical protein
LLRQEKVLQNKITLETLVKEAFDVFIANKQAKTKRAVSNKPSKKMRRLL